MAYKYHYEIYKNGVLYDTAQDQLMLCATKHYLIQYWGLQNYKNFTFKKVRISVEEWRKKYQ